MRTTLRSGPARAAAVLVAGALSLGLAAAPSAGGEVSGETPRRFDQVDDPRGDTERQVETTPRPGADRRLADLTKVRYRTPEVRGGDLRIVSRWNRLTDGSKPGGRRQVFVTYVQTGIPRDVLEVRVNNVTDRVRISDPTVPGLVLPPPEESTITRSFGPGGRIDLVLSSEWLGERSEVFLYSFAYSGGFMDSTDSTDDLAVGSPR